MDSDKLIKVRNNYFREFLKQNIRLYVSNHAAERATEGERGQEVREMYLSDFFETLLATVQKRNNQHLNFAFNQAKNNFLEQEVIFQADVGTKRRQINVPAVIKAMDDGLLYMNLKTVMVKERFKPRPDQRLIPL